MLTQPYRYSRKSIYIALALFMVTLFCGALLFFKYQADLIRENKYAEIRAIARLKSDEIIRWLSERYSDADYFSGSSELKLIIRQAQEGVDGTIIHKNFDRLFLRMRQNHHYADIMITDKTGHLFYSLDSSRVNVDPDILEIVGSVQKNDNLLLNDFSKSPDHPFIHLDIAAPIHFEKGIEGVLIFTIDPSTFLYPLVQSWPAPGKSSETLLLRREGNSILYLNPLKHAHDAALKLWQPLSDKSLPPLDAVNGKKESFEGKDYVGNRVIADIRPIIGTPWLMVAKINKREVFAELTFRVILQALMLLLLLLLLSSLVALLYNRRQKEIYEQLFLKEQEFRSAEEEFRITLYSIGDAVITTDADGKVRHMNMAAEKLTGWKEKQAAGRKFEDVFKIIHEKSRVVLDNPVHRVLKDGIVTDHANHTLLVSKDGREIPVSESGAVVCDAENRATGVVLVFHDITGRKEAEEEIKKLNADLEMRVEERTEQLIKTNRELEAFTYSVSHDLRTPLRAIDGFSAMLDLDYKDTLDAEARRLIRIIRQNAQKMGVLIDQLLTFSRLGRANLTFTSINIKEMVSSVINELTLPAERNNIDLTLKDLLPVKGDPGMIRQVWINLISNALKFSRHTTRIKIDISSREETDRIIYCIRDNGAGFDMKYYEKLFGVFQRLHTEKEFEGTGVGLAIVQQVIHRHGGVVWAESKINQGATFCFSLPK